MYLHWSLPFNIEKKENKNIHGIDLQKHLLQFYPNSIWLIERASVRNLAVFFVELGLYLMVWQILIY